MIDAGYTFIGFFILPIILILYLEIEYLVETRFSRRKLRRLKRERRRRKRKNDI